MALPCQYITMANEIFAAYEKKLATKGEEVAQRLAYRKLSKRFAGKLAELQAFADPSELARINIKTLRKDDSHEAGSRSASLLP